MEYKTGFIGCGNMASAIINGALKSRVLRAADVYVYDVDEKKAAAFAGANVCGSAGELANSADILFLCVKPNVVPTVAKEIKVEGKAFVSIAAGLRADTLLAMLPAGSRVLRTMPNTPLMVGKGAIAAEAGSGLTPDEKAFVYRIFRELGMLVEVKAGQMDAVTGVSGSGPAYVYLFIDALAKAGAQNGLDYETALALAVQTFEGACEMIKQTNEPPDTLIQKVCSPGGTTIEAMKVFQQEDIAGVIQRAVSACVKRSEELA